MASFWDNVLDDRDRQTDRQTAPMIQARKVWEHTARAIASVPAQCMTVIVRREQYWISLPSEFDWLSRRCLLGIATFYHAPSRAIPPPPPQRYRHCATALRPVIRRTQISVIEGILLDYLVFDAATTTQRLATSIRHHKTATNLDMAVYTNDNHITEELTPANTVAGWLKMLGIHISHAD